MDVSNSSQIFDEAAKLCKASKGTYNWRGQLILEDLLNEWFSESVTSDPRDSKFTESEQRRQKQFFLGSIQLVPGSLFKILVQQSPHSSDRYLISFVNNQTFFVGKSFLYRQSMLWWVFVAINYSVVMFYDIAMILLFRHLVTNSH